MKPFKILHISSERTWRGGEQQIAYLIDELENRGFINYVVCKKGSAFEKYCKKKILNYISLPFFTKFDLYTAQQIKLICREFDLHLIHAHTSHAHSMAVLSHLLGNNRPIVLSRRVDFSPGKNIFSKYKYNHPSIKKIICVSDLVRKITASSIREPEKCVTVYSGIDLERFSPDRATGYLRRTYNIPADIPVIGNISALADHKDYYTFIDVADQCLRKVKAHFFIIGKGKAEKDLKAYCKSRNLENSITFTGYLDNIPEVLPELDIFLMSSKTEGLGTTVLDAMASGVPVVSTKAGGIPEIIENGISGLLAPVKDTVSLADNVLRLLQDDHYRKKIIDGGQKRVKKFSKDKTAESTIAVYNNT